MALFGGAASPVLNAVSRHYRAANAASATEVVGAALVVFDGDSISGAGLGAHPAVAAAFEKRVPILLVDANEEHKQALVGPGRASGWLEGRSHAVLYTPFEMGNGNYGFHITEIGGHQQTYKLKKIRHQNGNVVIGNTSTSQKAHELTPTVTDRFVTRLRANLTQGWVDPIAGTVPAQVRWFSQPFELVESSQAYTNLGNQEPSENVTFIYRVFGNAGANGGFYSQVMSCEVQGTQDPGPLSTSSVTQSSTPGFLEEIVGWYQTMTRVSVVPNRSVPSGQALAGGVAVPSVSGSDYSYDADFPVFYLDNANNLTTWSPNLTAAANVAGWSTQATNTGDNQLEFFQTNPFDQRKPDYIDALDAGTKWYKPLPAASSGPLTYTGLITFSATKVIDGPVAVDMQVARTYSLLNATTSISTSLIVGAGADTVENEGNRRVVLAFQKALPSDYQRPAGVGNKSAGQVIKR